MGRLLKTGGLPRPPKTTIIYLGILLTLNFASCGIIVGPSAPAVNNPPEISSVTSRVYSVGGADNSILPMQDTPARFEIEASDPDGDELSFNCVFERPGRHESDPKYTAVPQSCLKLQSLRKFNDLWLTVPLQYKDGALEWNPSPSEYGTYKFTVSASDGLDSTVYRQNIWDSQGSFVN